ncbi:hypothetical protein GW916_04420 [bacterium]|nr:hypothetical protein [bacterium]
MKPVFFYVFILTFAVGINVAFAADEKVTIVNVDGHGSTNPGGSPVKPEQPISKVERLRQEAKRQLDAEAEELKKAGRDQEAQENILAGQKVMNGEMDNTVLLSSKIRGEGSTAVVIDATKASNSGEIGVVLANSSQNDSQKLKIQTTREKGAEVQSQASDVGDSIESSRSSPSEVVTTNTNTDAKKLANMTANLLLVSQAMKKSAAEQAQEQGVESSQSGLNRARSDVGGAASRTGGDAGGAQNGSGRKSIVDSMNEAAASSIGIGNGDFNLANFEGASPEIRSSLSNLALNSTAGYNGLAGVDALTAKTNELLNLAGDRNFQDLISSRFSKEAVRDFNLATAGAEIFGNPDLPEIGVAAAKSYILNNLSSSQILGSSPGLKSLAGKIGGNGGLLLQDPLTLRWLALANELGNGDETKIPKFLAINKETYKKAYPKLVGWLKGLNENESMSFLSKWKLTWSKGQYLEVWQDTIKSFAGIHKQTASNEKQLLKEAAGLLPDGKVEESQMFVSDLEKIAKWIQQNSTMKSGSLKAWNKNAGPKSKLGQIWYQNYKDEYQWANYYKSKMFFAASTYEKVAQDPDIKRLILDAQEWALFLEETKPTMAKPLAQSSGN